MDRTAVQSIVRTAATSIQICNADQLEDEEVVAIAATISNACSNLKMARAVGSELATLGELEKVDAKAVERVLGKIGPATDPQTDPGERTPVEAAADRIYAAINAAAADTFIPFMARKPFDRFTEPEAEAAAKALRLEAEALGVPPSRLLGELERKVAAHLFDPKRYERLAFWVAKLDVAG